MKINKIILFTLSICLFFAFTSCNKNSENESQSPELTENSTFKRKALVASAAAKVVLRHPGKGGCVCPGCAIPNCPCPLGVCAVFGIGSNNEIMEYEDEVRAAGDLGTAIIGITNDGKIHMSFDQETCYIDEDYSSTDKIVEITDDIELSATLCSELGVESVTVQAGVYYGDFSSNSNGEITCDATIIE